MRKTNNKGFSMTEVIVAVAVFLILAIPLFSQLVLSVKNNSKAKASQYGINVAESEMELLKSVDLNAIAKIYNQTVETDSTGAVVKTKYELPTTYAVGGDIVDGDIIESVFMTSPYATPSLLEFSKRVRVFELDKDGKCTFTYKQNVSSKEFEVVVTLDPTKYDGDAAGELTYNSPRDGAVQNLNKDQQAIIGSNLSALDQEAKEYFWDDGLLNNLSYQEQTLYRDYDELPPNYQNYNSCKIFRTTYITIDKNPDTSVTSKGEYIVTTRYEYDFEYKIAGVTQHLHKTLTDSTDEKLYFNTVPDIKFLYNQLIVDDVGTKAMARTGLEYGNDAIVFTNKLDYEQKTAPGTGGTGYKYYYTNSDLYLVFNNVVGVSGGARAYSKFKTCEISFGTDHNATQNKLNVYYSQTSDEADVSILNNLKVPFLLSSNIIIQSADKKVVQQDFQPIYDITIQVTPTNGNGMTTKMQGTRGQ